MRNSYVNSHILFVITTAAMSVCVSFNNRTDGRTQFDRYTMPLIEKDYRLFDPLFSENQRNGQKDENNVVETSARFFAMDEQKFQILNSSDIVVAELQGNFYVVHNSLPEGDWNRIKQGWPCFIPIV